jgi:hypothetical protein
MLRIVDEAIVIDHVPTRIDQFQAKNVVCYSVVLDSVVIGVETDVDATAKLTVHDDVAADIPS